MQRSKPAHHHGNLRQALIEAGTALIREGGPEALTIRGTAARVGVSHAAPKHHFPTLAHLRTAIVAQAHRDFTRAMEEAIASAPDTPRDAMVAAGLGYLRFSRANPSLAQVMLARAGLIENDAGLREAAAASRAVLARVAAPVRHGPEGPLGTETLIWSLAQGFAALVLAGKEELADPARAEEIFAAIFPELPIAAREV